MCAGPEIAALMGSAGGAGAAESLAGFAPLEKMAMPEMLSTAAPIEGWLGEGMPSSLLASYEPMSKSMTDAGMWRLSPEGPGMREKLQGLLGQLGDSAANRMGKGSGGSAPAAAETMQFGPSGTAGTAKTWSEISGRGQKQPDLAALLAMLTKGR